MSRLIVVSNRLPKDDQPAGGLVFALHELLSREGGIWIGADDPDDTLRDDLRQIAKTPYERLLFAVTPEEWDDYYLGYANGALWPLFHGRRDLMDVKFHWYDAYARVNARLAGQIAKVAQTDDIIWIHDYHFLPLAEQLRALGVKNRIGFFLHIPFPSAQDISALPQADKMVSWLSAFDIVGLQTRADVSNCLDFLRRSGEVELLTQGGRLSHNGKHFALASFPIGVDAEALQQAAETAAQEATDRLGSHNQLVLGVDRLDYSKGLVQRVAGFGQFLNEQDTSVCRPTYLQIAPVSREDVPAYGALREELDRIAGSVNGTHADLDWTPIRYVRRNMSRELIAGLYRRADVCLVTPLADGMNLVCKEFVAAQDPADPGALVLSQFAGAVEQLTGAILVNPHDTDDVAKAIGQAITMPLDERIERYNAMAPSVFDEDITWWGRTFLERLKTPTHTDSDPALDALNPASAA